MNLKNMKRILLEALKREKKKAMTEEEKLERRRKLDRERKRREYVKLKEDPVKHRAYLDKKNARIKERRKWMKENKPEEYEAYKKRRVAYYKEYYRNNAEAREHNRNYQLGYYYSHRDRILENKRNRWREKHVTIDNFDIDEAQEKINKMLGE